LDQQLIKLLLEKVSQKFGYSDPEVWQDGLYGALSEEIQKETRFLISRNTLKRLFGKIKTSEHYNPQIDTRNALAQFAGFPDWNKFRMMMIAEKQVIISEDSNAYPERQEIFLDNAGSTKQNWKKIGLILSLVFIAFIVGIQYFDSLFTSEPDYSKIKIEVQNPVDTAPFTLIVNYSIPEEIEDSIYIGFGGNKILLRKDKKLIVYSLYQPIYSFVYLKTKNKQIRAIPIKAYSRDLECYYESGKNVIMVPHKYFIDNGLAGLKRSFFESNRLDSSDFLTRFIKVEDYNLDGDNFEFQCKFKVDQSPKICHSFQLKLFADSGHHEMELFNKGCAASNFVAPAELYFGGKFENLTGLSAEASVWHELRIKVNKKEFRLLLDGKERFKSKYKKTMGKINVVKIQFNGFGQIDYFRMLDSNSKVVEQNEF